MTGATATGGWGCLDMAGPDMVCGWHEDDHPRTAMAGAGPHFEALPPRGARAELSKPPLPQISRCLSVSVCVAGGRAAWPRCRSGGLGSRQRELSSTRSEKKLLFASHCRKGLTYEMSVAKLEELAERKILRHQHRAATRIQSRSGALENRAAAPHESCRWRSYQIRKPLRQAKGL